MDDISTEVVADRTLSADDVISLLGKPFADLVFDAQTVHRRHHDPNRIQLSQLKSIKTGGCPEDCAYCPQSARFFKDTGLVATPLIDQAQVLRDARLAQDGGATRYCMGAAWRGPKDGELETVCELISAVKAMGLETCATLGLLGPGQAEQLAAAGLDYYNHNIDTSPEFYGDIITTRTFDDRMETLARVRAAGMHVCCGGIVGMGETREDRANMLLVLANMKPPPESVPINLLVQVPGTPLHGATNLDPFEFIRVIAAARILMPKSYVRLSAGREEMSDELQALAFLAGANSIFVGDELLTTANPGHDRDRALLSRLGIEAEG